MSSKSCQPTASPFRLLPPHAQVLGRNAEREYPPSFKSSLLGAVREFRQSHDGGASVPLDDFLEFVNKPPDTREEAFAPKFRMLQGRLPKSGVTADSIARSFIQLLPEWRLAWVFRNKGDDARSLVQEVEPWLHVGGDRDAKKKYRRHITARYGEVDDVLLANLASLQFPPPIHRAEDRSAWRATFETVMRYHLDLDGGLVDAYWQGRTMPSAVNCGTYTRESYFLKQAKEALWEILGKQPACMKRR